MTNNLFLRRKAFYGAYETSSQRRKRKKCGTYLSAEQVKKLNHSKRLSLAKYLKAKTLRLKRTHNVT